MATNSPRYDLHSHTTASDGELTPVALIDRAIKNQINVLAITDHDSISGLDEARYYITKNHFALQLINGVEISTAWNDHDIHIIGLNIDVNNLDLFNLLARQKMSRIERAEQISLKLAQLGITHAYQHAKSYAKGDVVSRAHLARYLVEIGAVSDISKAFKQYLGKGKKAYVTPKWCEIKVAVKIIHLAGGQAVLAHPMRYNLTTAKLRRLLNEFKEAGGDAIEISQSRQTHFERHSLEKYALEYGFLGSQGSDFHGLDSYLDLGQLVPFSERIEPIWQHWPSQCVSIKGK